MNVGRIARYRAKDVEAFIKSRVPGHAQRQWDRLNEIAHGKAETEAENQTLTQLSNRRRHRFHRPEIVTEHCDDQHYQ